LVKLPDYVIDACKIIIENGFNCYAVGGGVRDSLLNLTPTDWDLSTDALPEDVERIFEKSFPTGKRFGTISVMVNEKILEITTMRSDGSYSDGRHPDEVKFTTEIVQDLSRRDFTINAIAYHPLDKKFTDPFRGRKHLKKKLLMTVGDPRERFQEDPLRMLRLLRFQSTLDFKVDKKTYEAIPCLAPLVDRVSTERVLSELNKMLLGKAFSLAMQNFYSCGLLEEIIPELAACSGVFAGKNHPFDLLGHATNATHYAYPSLEIRWAALLHDLGKLKTLKREHQEISAELAEAILRRLKADNHLINKVTTLIANHMYDITPHSRDKTIRKFMAKVGSDMAYDLVSLRQADMAGMNKDPRIIVEYGKQMNQRLDQIVNEDSALSIKDLKIDGYMLMDTFDLMPGPEIGTILNLLLEHVLDNPALNNSGDLLSLARDHLLGK